jgi:hypothetical protein
MRSDIVPGGAFPVYELPDHTSTLRRLSGDDPLILTLARCHYCPKELVSGISNRQGSKTNEMPERSRTI